MSAGLLAAVSVAACDTDYTLGKDDPRYGEPNGLEGKRVPGARGALVSGGECVAPDAACAVKFSTDLLTPLVNSCGEVGCHALGSTPPLIVKDAEQTYEALKTWNNIENTPYVNPCSHDPQFSKLLCNVTPGAGACGPPMPDGRPPLDEPFRAKIETWVRCGAPFN